MEIRLSLDGIHVATADHQNVANMIDGFLIDGVYPDDVALYARALELQPVEAWRFHAVISSHGLKVNLENVLTSMSEPAQSVARARMEYSRTYDRFEPIVDQLSAALQLTSDQVDDLWREAAAL